MMMVHKFTVTRQQKAGRWISRLLFVLVIVSIFLNWLVFLVVMIAFVTSLHPDFSYGKVTISDEEVKYMVWFSIRSMLWKDITFVRIAEFGESIVFEAKGKSLSIPGPSNWSQKSSMAMQFIEQRARLLGISIERGRR